MKYFKRFNKKNNKEYNKNFKRNGWVVKNERPEELLGDPKLYYNEEEIEKYSKSGGMRRAQEKIAYRVLELLKLKKGSSLLDIGSGPGYTAEVYREEGYKVSCFDLMPKMLEKAKEKGFQTYLGDMRDIGEILKGKRFDGIVSVSALQWIKEKKDLIKVANGILSLIDKDSPLIIQFYPKSEKELKETAKIFTQNGFSGEVIIDNLDIPKNRLAFLCFKKD